jgi:hypothetical protein
MPGLNKFDDELDFSTDTGGETTVKARGPLDLAANEDAMVVCVQIFQNDAAGKLELVAQCNGAEHAFEEAFPPPEPGEDPHWACHGHLEPGHSLRVGQAVGTAFLVTGTHGGGFNTYTWTESFKLRQVP